ncbi:hypothetical protein HH614_003955 [Escherichia coli]|nr:hypothetical protein [Escherichia coli]
MQLASITSLELSTPLIFINSRSHTDSPGIVPSHPEDALRTLQILLPYITLNVSVNRSPYVAIRQELVT